MRVIFSIVLGVYLTPRAGFVYGGPHTAPSPLEEVQKHSVKHDLLSDTLVCIPVQPCHCGGTSQGTPLSKAPLLCCKQGNDSTFQKQLSGEAEEAMCVKHFILCLYCFLHLHVLVHLGCNNRIPQTAWLGDKENYFSQSGGESPRASAGRFLAHRC